METCPHCNASKDRIRVIVLQENAATTHCSQCGARGPVIALADSDFENMGTDELNVVGIAKVMAIWSWRPHRNGEIWVSE